MQFLADPERQDLEERAEARRGVGEVRLEDPLELQQGFVVEGDVVEIAGRQSRLGEAVVDRVRREAVVVLLSAEAFLLRSGNDLPVDEQRRRGVVIERRDAKDRGHGQGL